MKHRVSRDLGFYLAVVAFVLGGPSLCRQRSQLLAQVTTPSELPVFFVRHHMGTTGDWVPDVAVHPTKTAVADGNWSSPATWGGALPGVGDIVLIPVGRTVTYDTASATWVKTVGIKGKLAFRRDKNTKLVVGTIMAYAGSTLDLGDDRDPIRPGVKTEIVFDGKVNLTEDPGQFTIGLVAVDATVTIHGAKIAVAFSRLAATVKAGQNTITVQDAADWKVGDRLDLADTQVGVETRSSSFRPQLEQVTIARVLGRNSFMLTAPVRYAHEGYVAHLTRNVVFRSAEGAALLVDASTANKNRGHTIFMGESDVNVKYAQFDRLGRTRVDTIEHGFAVLDDTTRDAVGTVTHVGRNPRGRYSLHLHHVMKAALLEGNVIDDGLKWGITLHDGYAKITKTVVARVAGAGIVAEDGNETGLIDGNIVLGTGGGTGRRDDDEINNAAQRAINNLGNGGFGFWFHSPWVHAQNNVAAGYFNVEAFSYFLGPNASVKLSPISGADPADLAGIAPEILAGKTYVVRQSPIWFRHNAADVQGNGLGTWYASPLPGAAHHFTATLRAFNSHAVFYYYSHGDPPREHNSALSDSTLIGPYALGVPLPADPKKTHFTRGAVGEGSTRIINLDNVRIEGFDVGILVPGLGANITSGHLKNRRDIYIPSFVGSASSPQTNIVNVTFGEYPATAGQQHIFLEDPTPKDQNLTLDPGPGIVRLAGLLLTRHEVRVYNYNKTGRNFQVYYPAQRADFVIPILNLTNQQAWTRYRVAVGNDIAPMATLPKIGGFVGPIAEPKPSLTKVNNPTWLSGIGPNLDLKFSMVGDVLSEAPVVDCTKTVTIQPGFNMVPVTFAYGGKDYTTSIPLYGDFGSRLRAPLVAEIRPNRDVDRRTPGLQIHRGVVRLSVNITQVPGLPVHVSWYVKVNHGSEQPLDSVTTGGFNYNYFLDVTKPPTMPASYQIIVRVSDAPGGGKHLVEKTQTYQVVDSPRGPPNFPPTSGSLSYSSMVGTRLDGALEGSDPEFAAVLYRIARQPLHGTAIIHDPTQPRFTYLPNSGYVGPDSFTYLVNDGFLDSPPATISTNVTPTVGFSSPPRLR